MIFGTMPFSTQKPALYSQTKPLTTTVSFTVFLFSGKREREMGEECLNASKRRKIEDTVSQILRASELETITEFGVRSAAALQLGFELSGLNHRLLVRELVDSFLLATAAEILRTNSLNRINGVSNGDRSADYNVEQRRPLRRIDVDPATGAKYEGKIICKLSDKGRVTVHDFKGATVVSLRDFYVHGGNLLPVKGENSGISLTSTQWSSFRNNVHSIEEAIVTLESQLRSEAVTRQSKADTPSSIADFASEKSQTEMCISNSTSAMHLTGKRKRNQSEPVMRSSAADPTEKGQTQAATSNLVSIVHPHIKSELPEVDIPNAAISSISQEHILAEKAQEAPLTDGTTATSNYTERIPATRTEKAYLAENAQEAPVTDGTTATSNYTEQIPASTTEEASENSILVPPLPNHLERAAALSPEKLNHVPNDKTDIGVSASVPLLSRQGHPHHTAIAVPPEQLVLIHPTRFDGRNFHYWRKQMEMFLNQVGIAYVLSERCPRISLNAEASFEEKVGAKSVIQRWIADDHLCRHHILNSLCDSLFQLYSQKSFSAGELWEELRSVYNDDFGTKRSQINKYIHFQMVDEVSILDQVQELHNIADSIIASGTWIEENFHTSVIVSKLPRSWKELRLKLMQEEFLTLNMLMMRLRVEADRKEANGKKDHATEPKLDQRNRTKKDANKRVCFTCGMEGHMRHNCPLRKFEPPCDKSHDKEKGSLPPRAGAKMDDADRRSRFSRGKDVQISKNCGDRKFEPGEKFAILSPCTGEMDDAARPK